MLETSECREVALHLFVPFDGKMYALCHVGGRHDFKEGFLPMPGKVAWGAGGLYPAAFGEVTGADNDAETAMWRLVREKLGLRFAADLREIWPVTRHGVDGRVQYFSATIHREGVRDIQLAAASGGLRYLTNDQVSECDILGSYDTPVPSHVNAMDAHHLRTVLECWPA